jgi:hypothetical protein
VNITRAKSAAKPAEAGPASAGADHLQDPLEAGPGPISKKASPAAAPEAPGDMHGPDIGIPGSAKADRV